MTKQDKIRKTMERRAAAFLRKLPASEERAKPLSEIAVKMGLSMGQARRLANAGIDAKTVGYKGETRSRVYWRR